jgi:hypothetical protein
MSGALDASGGFEVPTPILNSPFVEPTEYWDLRDREPAAELLDSHLVVAAYIKNDGLNFTIPYLNNGKPSEYLPGWLAGTGS